MVWTSKGRKVSHMEMEKQMFCKKKFSGLSLTKRHRENFDHLRALRTLMGFSLSHLVYIKI